MHDGTLKTANTGIELHYRDYGGEGKPPLVLIHGLASTSRMWDFVAPILAGTYRVVSYDQRGHAESEKPDDGYDLPTMLADLTGLLDGLHIERPLLVGHSWGANLALAYAASYPDNCAGLALVDGGIYSFKDLPGADWDTVKRELAPPDLSKYTLADMVSRMTSGVLCHLPEAYMERYARSMMSVQPDGTIRAKLSREHHLDILHIIFDMDSPALLAKVKCPLLAIMAVNGEPKTERDTNFQQVIKNGAERVETLVPNAKLVWMENTIHDVPLQRPEELSRSILSFFSES